MERSSYGGSIMKFKVGDSVRIIREADPIDAPPLGQIGEVVAVSLTKPFKYSCVTGLALNDGCYCKVEHVILPEGSQGWFREDCLALVPPDKEQTVTWSQCIFKPKEMKV